MNLIYAIIKMIPTTNQIVFMSMQSDLPSLDFKLLAEEINNKKLDIKSIFLCKKMNSNLSKKTDYIRYVFNMIGYMFKAMYYLATSKVCITESYCVPISILRHKETLKIIQIWHASGAVKKFGYQCLDTKEGKTREIAELMGMHRNYDYVIAPSEITKNIFSEAFNIDKEKVVKLGLPRLEYITKSKYDKSEEIYQRYPELKDKKIILYVPTFRKGKNVNINEILNYPIDNDKYKVIIKLHPLEDANVPDEYLVDSTYTSFDLIKIADYIITDYSILSIEASILEKPVFLYLYDLEEYYRNRGLNIDLRSELKTFTTKTFSDIMSKIENNDFDIDEVVKYKEKYIEIDTKNTTGKLCDFILKLL